MSYYFIVCDAYDGFELPLDVMTTSEASEWLGTTSDALLKRIKNGNGEAIYNSYKLVKTILKSEDLKDE